jgi:hypothetical protein
VRRTRYRTVPWLQPDKKKELVYDFFLKIQFSLVFREESAKPSPAQMQNLFFLHFNLNFCFYFHSFVKGERLDDWVSDRLGQVSDQHSAYTSTYRYTTSKHSKKNTKWIIRKKRPMKSNPSFIYLFIFFVLGNFWQSVDLLLCPKQNVGPAPLHSISYKVKVPNIPFSEWESLFIPCSCLVSSRGLARTSGHWGVAAPVRPSSEWPPQTRWAQANHDNVKRGGEKR